jgi:hypothetical protein
LLESVYARCGLVSDVTLYEEYPSRYEIDAVRRHRWIRGDWQILPWLLPRVPDAEGRGIRNPISALSWWKIFDNLRRSLVPIALVLFFLASWLLVPRLGLLATGGLLAIVAPARVCFRSASSSCANRSSCRGQCICVECWPQRKGRSARSDLPWHSCRTMLFSV